MARILIIDDDVPLRGAVATMLTARGHETAEAGDAHSGVLEARAKPPDLIIMDVQMPAGGGPMVLQSLKSHEELADIPVIVVSGMPEAQLKKWFPNTPKRRCHTKPINWNLLAMQIDELLSA